MRVAMLCMCVLYAPYAGSASLQIDNQSGYIAVIIERQNTPPCSHASNLTRQCLVPPLTRFVDDFSATLAAEVTLRLVSMPAGHHASAEPLQAHAFKGQATVTYQPVGPLKYEQLTCHTPINEGVSIGLGLQDTAPMACEGSNTRRMTWVYKRNDLTLNVIIKDLQPARHKRH